jgi:hypothetical protein
MGWSDSHLHRFHIHGKDYGVAHEGSGANLKSWLCDVNGQR